MLPISAGRRMAILGFAIVTLAAGVVMLGVPQPQRLAASVAEMGAAAPLVVVVAAAILLAALVPRSVLAAAAGLVFGPWAGSLYVLTGAGLAALLAFAAGRWLGRDFVAARSRLAGVDAWLTARGAWGVAVLRILPIAPFGLISYGFGTTGIRLRSYLLGTAAGAAPGTVVYASLGASAMYPGSAGFLASVAAAAVLALGGIVGSAVVRRRRPVPTAAAGADHVVAWSAPQPAAQCQADLAEPARCSPPSEP